MGLSYSNFLPLFLEFSGANAEIDISVERQEAILNKFIHLRRQLPLHSGRETHGLVKDILSHEANVTIEYFLDQYENHEE